MMKTALILTAALLAGCVSKPEGVTPVSDFNITRYQGKWYEIARFDHRFERGLSSVTADYSPRPDGGIKDINVGLRWNWTLSPSWILSTGVRVARLQGDAKHSPLVERPTTFLVSSGLAYRY